VVVGAVPEVRPGLDAEVVRDGAVVGRGRRAVLYRVLVAVLGGLPVVGRFRGLVGVGVFGGHQLVDAQAPAQVVGHVLAHGGLEEADDVDAVA
jgi:hypothetical protein